MIGEARHNIPILKKTSTSGRTGYQSQQSANHFSLATAQIPTMAQFIDDQAQAAGAEPAFRLSAKALFLTYPRCPIDKEECITQLRNILGVENTVYIVVGMELHADGEPHLHAVCILRTRCNYRDPYRLDLYGADQTRYHGNYVGSRNVVAAIAYTKKDGNFAEYGECPPQYLSRDDRKQTLNAVAQLRSERELSEYLYLNRLSHDERVLTRYWNASKKARKSLARFNLDSFNVPADLIEAVNTTHQQDKALVIIGPTGIGKTQAVLSLTQDQNPLRLTELDNLKFVNEEHQTLVLDDCQLSTMGRSGILALLDVKTERTIRCRYSNAELSATLKVIVIGNSMELIFGELATDEALLRRINVFVLPNINLF